MEKTNETIAEETDGDLFRILTEEPYGDDLDHTASRAQTELNNETRPVLSAAHIDPEVMAGYDVICLGFPVRWYDLPTPVWTFLEEYGLSGKTVIPFFSHNGSLTCIAQLAPKATVLTGKALSTRGSSVSGAEQQGKNGRQILKSNRR